LLQRSKIATRSSMFLWWHIDFASPAFEHIFGMLGEVFLCPQLGAHGACGWRREILTRQSFFQARLGIGGQAVYEHQRDHGNFPCDNIPAGAICPWRSVAQGKKADL
jgi:hypothetical protein